MGVCPSFYLFVCMCVRLCVYVSLYPCIQL